LLGACELLGKVEISNKRAFRTKLNPSAALRELPNQPSSDVYQAVYKVYLKKFTDMMTPMPAASTKAGRALDKLAKTLNIGVDRRNCMPDLPSVLARLRTLDIVEAPV
jgi:hypothetical protein